MTQRGRKSVEAKVLRVVAAQSTPSTAPRKRQRVPAPPPELSDQEAAVWRRVTRAMGAPWYRESMRGLLIELCRHTVAGDQLAHMQRLAYEQGDVKMYDRFARAARSNALVVAKLAHALQIDQTWTPEEVGEEQPQAPRPWEAT